MFCATGVIGSVKKHGIALIDKQSSSNEIAYYEDTYCEVEQNSLANQMVIQADCSQN